MLDQDGEQAAVLKSLIHVPGLMSTCFERMGPILFAEDARPLAETLWRHYKKFGRVPTKTAALAILRQMKQAATFRDDVASLWQNGQVEDPDWARQYVREWGRKQQVSLALERMQGEVDVDVLVTELTAAADWPDEQDRQTTVDLWDASKRKPFERVTVKSGLYPLDETTGGLGKGEMGVVMAPSGQGKSTLLVNFGAHAVLTGLMVAHITLELSATSLMNRYRCNLSGMTAMEQFRHPVKFKKALQAVKRKRGLLQVFEFPADVMTTQAIDQVVRRYEAAAKRQVDLILVDYLSLVKPADMQVEKRHQLGGVAKDLRSLATRRNIPVWTAAQTQRGTEDREVIEKRHVGESKEIVDAADIVIGFVIHQELGSPHEVQGRLHVAKSRDTQGEVEFDIQINFQTMQAMAV